ASRDVKGGIGLRAGFVKACCGAGLGRCLVGPFFAGLAGRSPATLILHFPFVPPSEKTRERERECDKKAMRCEGATVTVFLEPSQEVCEVTYHRRRRSSSGHDFFIDGAPGLSCGPCMRVSSGAYPLRSTTGASYRSTAGACILLRPTIGASPPLHACSFPSPFLLFIYLRRQHVSFQLFIPKQLQELSGAACTVETRPAALLLRSARGTACKELWGGRYGIGPTFWRPHPAWDGPAWTREMTIPPRYGTGRGGPTCLTSLVVSCFIICSSAS
ncbi:hypothetical protein IGI04_002826, partial [Brassica rapa subsp. trilocularis]